MSTTTTSPMPAVTPFDHPYFDHVNANSCSVCHQPRSRTVCPMCQRPACPVAARLRVAPEAAADAAAMCVGCRQWNDPATAAEQDAAHEAACEVCRADAPLRVCGQCGWMTCAHCDGREDVREDHAQRCAGNTVSAAHMMREAEDALTSGTDTDVAVMILVEVTRRLGSTYQPRHATPVKARAEWDLHRARGIGKPSGELLTALVQNLPGWNTRGTSMAEIIMLALIYRTDVSPEAQMQALFALFGMYNLKNMLHQTLANMGDAALNPADASESCYMVSPQAFHDCYKVVMIKGATPRALWRRDTEAAGVNVVYLVTLVAGGRDENQIIMGVGNPDTDPEAAAWSPAVRAQRTKQWAELAQRCGSLMTHQILVRIGKSPEHGLSALVLQSHSRLYSIADWIAGQVPLPDRCAEWLPSNSSRSKPSINLDTLGALLEQLADARGVDDAQRAILYTRLTGVPRKQPLAPMRLILLRANLNI